MKEDLIYDVGMHLGEDAEFYLKKGFSVVGIEANPVLCERVGERLGAFSSTGQLTIVNAAIVQNPGPTSFFVNNHVTEWGTAQKSWVERNDKIGMKSSEIRVTGMSFDQVLAAHGVPYYLKIDIEGNDVMCLEALLGRTSLPKHISIESEKRSWRKLRYEFNLFEKLGYQRFKVVNQVYVPRQICPNPPREGAFIEHQFKYGSSGLFGEEAPGSWMSRTTALAKYRWIFLKYGLTGNDGLIPNLHHRLRVSKNLKRAIHPGWYDTHATR